MKRLIIGNLLLAVYATAFSQESHRVNASSKMEIVNNLAPRLVDLDTSAIAHWPTVIGGQISNNGQYCAYYVASNAAPEAAVFRSKAIFKSIRTKWQHLAKSISGTALFSADSKYAFYRNGDSLRRVILGGRDSLLSTGVSDFKLLTVRLENFLVYLNSNRQLTCLNLSREKKLTFNNIVEYSLNEGTGGLYLISKDHNTHEVEYLDLATQKQHHIFESKVELSNLVVSDTKRLAFRDSRGNLFLGKVGQPAVPLVLNLNTSFANLQIESPERFEGDGTLLVIEIKESSLQPLIRSINPVKIFSYQDPEFYAIVDQSERSRSSYRILYNISSGKIIRLESNGSRLIKISKDGRFAYISQNVSSDAEYYWNRKAQNSGYVLDLTSGNTIGVSSKYPYFNEMSPLGGWLLVQDDQGGDVYSINLLNGKRTNLTKDFPIPKYDSKSGEPMDVNSRSLSFFKWTKEGSHAIIYDRYDIWLVDPSSREKPLNLTGGIGRTKHILFRLLNAETSVGYSRNESVLLTAFSEDTKENGFFRLTIGKPSSLSCLIMNDCFYYAPGNTVPNWQLPIKAKFSKTWLIPRQSSEQSRNLFVTTDFKTFNSVSDEYPERNYNWFKSELINFTTEKGIKLKAILYKPLNFDPKRKYPVLFNYYQCGESDKLNTALSPKYLDAYYFNYALMLSKGYLVCLTDTYQKPGETAFCLVDAIEGAADKLAKLPYVDSQRYGACGGSFGGYATNLLAAKSKKFRALISISGETNLISKYGTVPGNAEEHTENRQSGMGVSLGSDPKKYLENSPINYSKEVETPILLVNTLHDGNVNVQQGIEWFISLRREGKLAWMLQYQEKGHGIRNPENEKDLYIRMNQFFDHYLKGAPAPVWMTRVQSANDRGVKDEFEYDTEIKTPGPSQLINSQK